jgi:prepilin peptidase CpaA
MLTALWVHPNPYVQWGIVLVCTMAAALVDVRTGRIPNWLTGTIWLAGLTAAVTFAGLPGAVDALAGCVVMAAPFVLLFLVGGGAADAKLMGAIGMWLGFANGVVALLAVLIVGAVVGICYAIVRQRSQSVLANLWQMATGMLGVAFRTHKLADVPAMLPQNTAMVPMPYGVSIFLGVAVSAAGLLAFRSGVQG